MSCVPATAGAAHEGHGANCVAYAREVTGIRLDGNAASWWLHAEGRYDRGQQPAAGAILVFRPYGGMHVGHVAVVSQVIGPREILVDQANWVRGRVTRAMSVVDASPLNDWTSVKVQFAGTHGRANPTYGFIYPRVLPASFGETIVEPQQAEHEHPAPAVHDADKAAPDEARHGDEEARHADAKPQDKDRHDHKKAAKADTAKAHAKDRHEPTDTAKAAAEPSPHRLAANGPPHHKHKAPDAKLAYVY